MIDLFEVAWMKPRPEKNARLVNAGKVRLEGGRLRSALRAFRMAIVADPDASWPIDASSDAGISGPNTAESSARDVTECRRCQCASCHSDWPTDLKPGSRRQSGSSRAAAAYWYGCRCRGWAANMGQTSAGRPRRRFSCSAMKLVQ